MASSRFSIERPETVTRHLLRVVGEDEDEDEDGKSLVGLVRVLTKGATFVSVMAPRLRNSVGEGRGEFDRTQKGGSKSTE